MKQLMEFLLQHLVENPEEVRVTVEDKESVLVITVSVSSGDIGRVIGREGKTINALRTIAKILSTKQKKGLDLNLLS